MVSVNILVFSEDIARAIGKKSSETDITFYDKIAGNTLFTGLLPKNYPDKVFPLTQAAYLSNFVILDIEQVNAELGEKILVLDALKKKNGILFLRNEVVAEQYKQLVAGTVLENYSVISDIEKITEELNKFSPKAVEGELVIDIDGCFDVKSVGTVILGYIRSGKVKKYDKLELMPVGKECIARSMQLHDKDAEEAGCYARVGLAVKGVTPDEVKRGNILTEKAKANSVSEISGSFEQNKYYKKKLEAGMQLHAQIGLSVVGCIVKSIEPFTLTLSQAVAVAGNETNLILDINSKLRIAGILK